MFLIKLENTRQTIKERKASIHNVNFQIPEDKPINIIFSLYYIRFKNIIIVCIFQLLKNEYEIIRSIVILEFWEIDQN